MKKWGDIKPSAMQDKKWEDQLDWGSFTDGDYMSLRPVGPVGSAVYHWVQVIKRDGTTAKFPMTCGSYDPKTEQFINDDCPSCRCNIDANRFYFSNFIDRNLQENQPIHAIPEKKSKKKKFRKVGDKSWSPNKVFKIPIVCASQFKNIVGLNKHKIKGKMTPCELSDPDYGCDVFVKYDSGEAPATSYDVQKGDHSPLTKRELRYRLFDVENVVQVDMAKQESNLVRLGYLKSSDVRFLDEEDAKRARIGGKERRRKLKGKKGKVIDIEDDIGEEEEEEERIPRKKRKKSSAKKSKKLLKSKRSKLKKLKKSKSKKLKCFGDYKGKFKCFKCDDRTECIKAT